MTASQYILETVIYIPSIIGLIVIAIMTFSANEKKRGNVFFGITSLILSLWLLLQFVAQILGKTSGALLLIRFSIALSVWIAIFGSAFLRKYSGIRTKRGVWIAQFILGSAFSLLCLTDLVIIAGWGDVTGIVIKEATSLYYIVIVFIFLMFAVPIARLLISTLKVKDIRNRSKNISLIFGISQAIVLAIVGSLFFGESSTAQFLITYSMLFMCLIIFFSIIKYGLFDIKLAAVRTAGYLLTVAVMAIFYVMSAYSLSLLFFKENVTTGVSSSPINVALALALALIFQPIKNFFDKLTNNIFYRGEYEQDKFIRQFGKILSYDTDLKLLLNKVSLHIAENLKAEQVFFYVKDRGIYGKYSPAHPKFTDHDIESLIDYSTHIQISSGSEVIMANHIKNVHLGRLINKQKIKIILPLKLQSETIGFLFVGEHKSRGYSIRDLKTLDSISNELTIAVQNSLSVEEVRDLNENLQRKVNQATKELLVKNRQLKKLDEAKDEFMSIASHQLRTPLTSIKGYLDMVLDGDLGEVKPKQKTVLSEAFMSSERMVQLINDFLNVSRLQTGKFVIEKRESNLPKILKEEIRLLSVVAKQREIKLKTKITDNLPMLNIDADKLRQVMINMIDNAIYYSKGGMTVMIELGKVDGQVVFRVIDTGIGVPEIDQAELFTKFFRASNARKKRPDGTGVGLFLARKVIVAHGGDVIFKSVEDKGSTFGFTLPIK